MAFLEELQQRAAVRPRRIALPEGDDPRVREAAEILAHSGAACPVVFSKHPPATSSPRVEWINPLDPAVSEQGVARLAERLHRRKRTVDPERVRAKVESARDDALTQAALMLAHDEVDGVVAGCVLPTSAVLRAALACVGLQEGCETLSSAFYMVVDPMTPTERVLTFTDAGVVPMPTPAQLVDIAASAADARQRIVGDEPRVAFLSFSTHGSADSADVRRVREAAQGFRARFPSIQADGELQGDAALVREVRARKAPESPLAESANVLVFPSLDAGNIAYKLVQRLAGATALGPVLQGLAAPLNDLSRGATAADIALVSCITALQCRK